MKTTKVKLDNIKPYEKNNKIHPKEQIDEIRKSIVDFGYIQNIVIDKNNEIIIGHGRFEAIKQLREMGSRNDEVDVVRMEDLTEKQSRKLRLLDNKTSDMADRDFENIQFELGELEDIELDGLFDFGDMEDDVTDNQDKDIDFDNIKSNENREVGSKERKVVCPDCGSSFTI